jgi:hypothetical protein
MLLHVNWQQQHPEKGLFLILQQKQKTSNHETDKQSEDNATWFFEYRALLNSKLTTLITSLTSAYTTDLDASMGAQSNTQISYDWETKSAMQGITGQKDTDNATIVDPGAARSAYAYFNSYGMITMASSPSSTDWSGDDDTAAGLGATATITYKNNSMSGNPSVGTIGGTSTFLTGGSSTFLLDNLKIDFLDSTNNKFTSNKGQTVALTATGISSSADIGNNLEMALYKFFKKPENFDLLRFGLFQDVFIVGTSSLPTGSQVQGSIKLNYEIPTVSTDSLFNKSVIRCTQERYAAFFHS